MGSREGTEVGRLELIVSIVRRSQCDEFYNWALADIRDMAWNLLVVTGNTPAVLRESLLPEAFRMGEGAVASSLSWRKGLAA